MTGLTWWPDATSLSPPRFLGGIVADPEGHVVDRAASHRAASTPGKGKDIHEGRGPGAGRLIPAPPFLLPHRREAHLRHQEVAGRRGVGFRKRHRVGSRGARARPARSPLPSRPPEAGDPAPRRFQAPMPSGSLKARRLSPRRDSGPRTAHLVVLKPLLPPAEGGFARPERRGHGHAVPHCAPGERPPREKNVRMVPGVPAPSP